jgi:uncharacterized protein (TIGR02757 family)
MLHHQLRAAPDKTAIAVYLEDLYGKYHHPEFIHPDPLEFLSRYPCAGDREIVALVAALLAYGRVAQILKSVEKVLSILTISPRDFLVSASPKALSCQCAGFVHRFTKAEDLSSILVGIRSVLRRQRSLEACFRAGDKKQFGPTILPGLIHLVQTLGSSAPRNPGHILPDPTKGSALKRFNLFLRWMVRKDAVDPGGWAVNPGRLIVPLDVHMHRMALCLGFTGRKSADMKTALETTEGFRSICPEDPVRFDFCVTRLGILKIPIPRVEP